MSRASRPATRTEVNGLSAVKKLLVAMEMAPHDDYPNAASQREGVAMRVIELDASGWKTVLDFYDALLPELGASPGHGRGPDALIDSVIWGGINIY